MHPNSKEFLQKVTTANNMSDINAGHSYYEENNGAFFPVGNGVNEHIAANAADPMGSRGSNGEGALTRTIGHNPL